MDKHRAPPGEKIAITNMICSTANVYIFCDWACLSRFKVDNQALGPMIEKPHLCMITTHYFFFWSRLIFVGDDSKTVDCLFGSLHVVQDVWSLLTDQ